MMHHAINFPMIGFAFDYCTRYLIRGMFNKGMCLEFLWFSGYVQKAKVYLHNLENSPKKARALIG